jgi:hypothetical protein
MHERLSACRLHVPQSEQSRRRDDSAGLDDGPYKSSEPLTARPRVGPALSFKHFRHGFTISLVKMRLKQKHRLVMIDGYRAATRVLRVGRIEGEDCLQYYYTNILETRNSAA